MPGTLSGLTSRIEAFCQTPVTALTTTASPFFQGQSGELLEEAVGVDDCLGEPDLWSWVFRFAIASENILPAFRTSLSLSAHGSFNFIGLKDSS